MTASRIISFAQGGAKNVADEAADKAIITAKGVSKIWDGNARGEGGLVALTPLDLEIKGGEFVVLLGPSGCGKSTLLRLVAGLEKPTTGEIRVAGRLVQGPGWERGMIFQDYALFPWRSVLRNITFGLEARGVPHTQRNEKALDLIRLVGLGGFERAYPSQLSGGMQQRVAGPAYRQTPPADRQRPEVIEDPDYVEGPLYYEPPPPVYYGPYYRPYWGWRRYWW